MVDIPNANQVTGLLAKFANEEQDPAIVEQVHEKVSEILTSGEDIIYIAVQKKLGLNMTPDSAVLTTRRFIIYKPKLLGRVEFEDHIWRDLKDAHVKEGLRGATLTMKTMNDGNVTMDNLPKAQARKLYTFAQEMEEKVCEERRARELEEKRAAAGGITLQSPMPTVQPQAPQQEDPLQKLKQLKGMLDAGLITEAEYNSKKTDILSRM